MKPLVFQELGDGLNRKSQANLSNLINSYFKLTIWWLEKDDWNSMSEFEEMAFADKARTKKNPTEVRLL
ncbi:MAG: hypothetical protein ACYTBW_01285 [Planctomycetota bacterium]|jgi:hypothetical protein